MFSTKLLLFALGACLAGEGCCSVSGPKDSANGVRGRGQRMPQVFDLGSLEELKDIASQFNGKDYSSRYVPVLHINHEPIKLIGSIYILRIPTSSYPHKRLGVDCKVNNKLFAI